MMMVGLVVHKFDDLQKQQRKDYQLGLLDQTTNND